VRSSGESVTNYVTLLLVEFDQPCPYPIHVLRIAVSALRGRTLKGAWLHRNAQTGISQKIREVSTSVVVLQAGSLLCHSSTICCYHLRPLRQNNERNLRLYIYNFVPFDVATSVVFLYRSKHRALATFLVPMLVPSLDNPTTYNCSIYC